MSGGEEGRGGKRPSRRGLLKAGMGAAAIAGTGAWRAGAAPAGGMSQPTASMSGNGTRQPSAPPAQQLRQPGSLPYPHLMPGTDTIPQIEHIIVIMQENHSYDNRLGMLRRPDADGFKLGPDGLPTATNPYSDGRIQHAFHMPTTCQPGGVSQNWVSAHIQFANGKGNGFVESPSGALAMGYWQEQDQPFYYSMASIFPICDRYFSSVLGQTDPNRMYLLAATSHGLVNDDTPPAGLLPPNGTILDRLDAHQISWRNYFSSVAATVGEWPPLLAKNMGTRVLPISEFFSDAAAGTLPSFSLVEPDFGVNDEENPQNIAFGEQFVASVVNAAMSGPGWHKTLLIWTYDEWGGWADHVVPPPTVAPDDIPPMVPAGSMAFDGFARYGFRVPTCVISPWARPHYVSHQVFDHTSILKTIETKWNLPALTFRDANALPMLDMLDFRFPAFLKPPKLSQPLLDTNSSALACATTGPGTIPPAGTISNS